MRLASLFFIALSLSGACRAQEQATIFTTHADYANAKGDTVGAYVDIVPSMGQYALVFSKDGEKRKIPCTDIWGFALKGVLFRIEQNAHLPVRLMTKGAVAYYENGFAHLIMQRDGTELEFFDVGHQSYLSHDLESAIVPAIFKVDDASASGTFRKAHPQYEPLFTCLGDQDVLDRTRQCVVDFEASLEGE